MFEKLAVLAAALVVLVASGFVVSKATQLQPAGAVSGPDISSRYLRWGGVATWASRTDSLIQASTTMCSIQAPAATSTLVLGSGIRLDVSSTTATVVRAFKSSLPATATTFLFGANVAANARATIVASTSADAFVFGPNEWLNVVASGGTGTFSPSGACQAQFVAL